MQPDLAVNGSQNRHIGTILNLLYQTCKISILTPHIEDMGLLQDKLSKYRLPQKYQAEGVYPYFREIDSHQDTEVITT